MRIPNLVTGVTARLPDDYATYDQIAEAVKRLSRQQTLTTGPEDAIATLDAPAGQRGSAKAKLRARLQEAAEKARKS